MKISIEKTKHSGYCLYDGNDCMLLIHGDSGRAETFAEIERRVNNHEQLVAALERIAEGLGINVPRGHANYDRSLTKAEAIQIAETALAAARNEVTA